MKKIILGLFAIVCLFALVACGEQPGGGDNPGGGDQPGGGEVETPTMDDYKEEVFNYLNESIPSEITENVEMPDFYAYEDGALAEFAWVSSNGKTLSSKGKFRANLFDEDITLTATVLFYNIDGEQTEIFTHDVKVKTKGTEDLEAYKKIIEGYLPDFVYQDFELVEKDATFKGKNAFGKITYKSSREDVITSDGKYVNSLAEDQDVEFFYTVEINGIIIEGSKIIKAEGKKFEYYTQQAVEYLEKYFKDITVVYDKVELPKTDELGRVEIVWTSSDLKVISNDGALQTFDPDKEVKMTAEIKCYDGQVTWEKQLRTYNKNELIEFIVNRIHRDEIKQYVMGTYAYNRDNYGFIPFYYQDSALGDLVVSSTPAGVNTYLEGEHNPSVKRLKVVTGIVPWSGTGRTKMKQVETAFITVHDTGSADMSAAQWNDYESSGRDTRQTSWHFTVGEDTVYQQIPLEEVAWHAGDGSAMFGLKDTGVKYVGPDPEITIGEDHFLYINGEKSKIGVPLISGSSRTEWNGRFANAISKAGLYTCLGENGNYYMANVHASNYWQNSSRFEICTNGGNRNSIGIETSIWEGGDYNVVMRNTASLIASLLKIYNLKTDRVLYHQSFSGKLCPQVMIENGLIPNFENMVENEYIIKTYLPGIQIKYESHNPDLLSNEGYILKEVTKDTKVSYTVTITYNGETKTFDKETIIKPIR